MITETEYDDLGRVTKARNYHPSLPSRTTAPKVEQRYEYEQFEVSDWQHVRTVSSQWGTTNGTNFTNIGTTVSFVDPMGRVARIEDTPAGQSTKRVEYHYDQATRVIEVARTAGTFSFDTRYQYDQAGRVTSIGHYRDGSSTAFTQYEYRYDLADRIITHVTSHDTTIAAFATLASFQSELFQFDKAGQLTSANKLGSSDDESFTYDANGNRVTSTSNGTTVTGVHNRLLEDANYTYQYDKEGNRIRKTSKSGGSYTQYVWDAHHRLIQAQDYNATNVLQQTVTYRYDAGDNMVFREVMEFGGGSGTVLSREKYAYNGSKLALSVKDEADVPMHRYTWGPGTGQLLADEIFDAAGQLDETLWAATDHLGSVNDLLDSTEAIVEHREFNSFGEFDAVYDEVGNTKSTATLLSDIGHAGSLWDDEAEVYRKGNRPYDPFTSQFLTTDFGGFIDGPNLYWYAKNNPIIYFDPSGFTAIKPTDNLFGGGYSGGKIGAKPKAFSFNPIIDFGPKQSPIPASAFSMNSVLDRNYGKPASTPRINDFNSYGPLIAPVRQQSIDVNAVYGKAYQTSYATRNYLDEQHYLGRLDNAARNGSRLTSAAAEAALFADRQMNNAYSVGFGVLTEPTFFVTDTAASLSGHGSNNYSTTYQTFNSNPDATFLQNLNTGGRKIRDAVFQVETVNSAITAYNDPTRENLRALADNSVNTALFFGLAGGRGRTASNAPVVDQPRPSFYNVADNGIDLTGYSSTNAIPSHFTTGRLRETDRLVELGLTKNNSVWRPTHDQTQSAAFQIVVGQPRYTPTGLPVGTIFDATQNGLFEYKSGSSMLNSTYQLRLQTYRSLVDDVSFTIETTRPINSTFQSYLDRWGVDVRKPR